MDDVRELVMEAWELMRSMFESGERALAAGTDTAIVNHMIGTALRQLEDIEAYALLAASGDTRARSEIERLIVELEELRDSLPGAQER